MSQASTLVYICGNRASPAMLEPSIQYSTGGVMSIDQRQSLRTPMSEETIYFAKDDSDSESDRIHYYGMIINISSGGIGLRANIAHEPNEELWFEGIEEIGGTKAGKVRWTKALDEQEMFEIGVQF